MKLLVTGGAGFIGSALIRHIIRRTDHIVVNVDKLTYAASPESLASVSADSRYTHELVDICDRAAVIDLFDRHRPDGVIHLAAESHVDRSIDSPSDFISTNVVGTSVLLEVVRAWSDRAARAVRFHHVSTDEVYGDLEPEDAAFTEGSSYRPSSPYAASKAASDHLVRAWHRTYGLPAVITNCSNNYGPFHFPEKFIPHMIVSALQGQPLPVYGDGAQVRDWLHVDDHAEALLMVFERGRTGETYNIGADSERRNLDVVTRICDLLDARLTERPAGVSSYSELISMVADRPGHDRRYAIDASRLRRELGWRPRYTFETGLAHTVDWYLSHRDWWMEKLRGSYRLERKGMAQ